MTSANITSVLSAVEAAVTLAATAMNVVLAEKLAAALAIVRV
jgi:hypothetical protein